MCDLTYEDLNMAHEIDMSNGRANMIYVGQKPWHGLGFEIDATASIEEILVKAGLNWEALKAVPQFIDNNGVLHQDEERAYIYRSDTKKPLSVMGMDYKIVQPAEILEYYRNLSQQHGFLIETAGSLFDGKRIWALAKTDNEFTLPGGDKVTGYLLMATSMDGTLSTVFIWTSVRVVCNNTLQMSFRDNRAVIKKSHRGEVDFTTVKEDLDIATFNENWMKFSDLSTELAKRRVSNDEALNFVLNVFVDKKDEETQAKALRSKRVKDIWESITNSPGANMKSAAGTAWGLLNGATHYIDHVAGRNQNNRLSNAFFGSGTTSGVAIKQRALEEVSKLIEETPVPVYVDEVYPSLFG